MSVISATTGRRLPALVVRQRLGRWLDLPWLEVAYLATGLKGMRFADAGCGPGRRGQGRYGDNRPRQRRLNTRPRLLEFGLLRAGETLRPRLPARSFQTHSWVNVCQNISSASAG